MDEEVERILVGLAVEGVLIEMGVPIYEKVTNLLYKEYNCQLVDCYDHPEYVNKVLKRIFGNSSRTIVEKIQEELEKFTQRKSIKDFLIQINE